MNATLRIYSLLLFLAISTSSFVFAQEFAPADPQLISLFPLQNEVRNAMNISGIWKFKKDSLNQGEHNDWEQGLSDTRSIAVPGSWNDQFTDSRDYLGYAWYEKDTYIPAAWKNERIFIRVGSANYMAKVWVNGQPVGMHEGGNLPFAFEITSLVTYDAANRISIQIENILKPDRVPVGGDAEGAVFSSFPKANFDFFPFAGLHRDVWIYSLSKESSIQDVRVVTGFSGSTGKMDVLVKKEGNVNFAKLIVSGNGNTIESNLEFSGDEGVATMEISQVRLWDTKDPFLYQVEVILGEEKQPIDNYTMETGIRTIAVNENEILLNGKPVFLKGFGKHEDFPIFGRGTANPVIIKDFALLKWTGANSFRTSHYPYDEEFMRMADREGFLVINEIPAVGLYFHGNPEHLQKRTELSKQYIRELIARDKNHPSVIMWCVANEPFPRDMSINNPQGREAEPQSIAALGAAIAEVRKNDSTRLAVLVGVMGGPTEWLELSDVMLINRYYGWYTHVGDLAAGLNILNMELDGLHKKFKKPIMVTEFGADTYPGMHSVQAEMFTEEFQVEFIKGYLDIADSKPFVTGMHVWAFSDFKTGQGIIRFGGINYKGVFTRDRQPKAAATYLRQRWSEK